MYSSPIFLSSLVATPPGINRRNWSLPRLSILFDVCKTKTGCVFFCELPPRHTRSITQNQYGSCVKKVALRLVVAARGRVCFQRLFRDIETFYFEHSRITAQRRRGISRRNFALFPRKQREIIVFPQDRSDISPAFVTSDSQVHHECDAVIQIFYCHSSRISRRVCF